MYEVSLVVIMCIEKNWEKLDLGEGLGLIVYYDVCVVIIIKVKMVVLFFW